MIVASKNSYEMSTEGPLVFVELLSNHFMEEYLGDTWEDTNSNW